MTIVTAIVSPSARPKTEHDSTDDARSRKEQRRLNRLESCRPERMRTLTLRDRDDFSTSRDTDEVNGTIMMASTRPAVSMPTPTGGPLKSGSCRRQAVSRSPGSDGRDQHENPHNPYTIEGIAASNSVRNTSGCRSRAGQVRR